MCVFMYTPHTVPTTTQTFMHKAQNCKNALMHINVSFGVRTYTIQLFQVTHKKCSRNMVEQLPLSVKMSRMPLKINLLERQSYSHTNIPKASSCQSKRIRHGREIKMIKRRLLFRIMPHLLLKFACKGGSSRKSVENLTSSENAQYLIHLPQLPFFNI